ncbi:MAG: CoA-binding protein [Dehalococcoidia bacterium]|nr:CoA-binding protein [Dehalococcoidia bacterium]
MNRTDSFSAIFDPASVAVTGVSPGSAGERYTDYLLTYGFKGKIYPLRPKGGEFRGMKIYKSIKDVAGPVDLIICCIPAQHVPDLLRESAAKGVKAAILHTAGFSETGRREGQELEAEVVRVARATGMRLVGPNCMGIYRPRAGLAFAYEFPRESGRTALICQSGGNSNFLIRAAAERGIRFSKAVSYGNACDVNETDLMEYFIADDETDLVAAYIEGVKDGPRFRDVLRRLSAVKPVIVLKGGATPAGKEAAASHTAALAGSDAAWNAVFSQSRAVRVDTLDEMVDMMVTFRFMPVPPRGKRIATMGVGGGVSVLATDECHNAGFLMAPLDEAVRRDLTRNVASDAGAMLSNPVDFPFWTMSEEHFRDAIRTLMKWEGIDLFLFLAPLRQSEPPLAEYVPFVDYQLSNLIKVAHECGKPTAVVINFLATGQSWLAAAGLQQKCYEAGLPTYHSTASALKAIGRLMRYHEPK